MININSTQVAEMLNKSVAEFTGVEPVSTHPTGDDEGNADAQTLDLKTVVDKGAAIIGSSSDPSTVYKNVFGAFIGRLAAYIMSIRKWTRPENDILMNNRTWGAIVEKIYVGLGKAEPSAIWNLADGESVDPFKVTALPTKTRIFKDTNAFQVPWTRQTATLRKAFESDDEMMRFVSAVDLAIENTIELNIEQLKNSTISNFISGKYNLDKSNAAGVHAVHLVTEFNVAFNKSVTPISFMYDAEALRFANYRISSMYDKLGSMTGIFNESAEMHFVPREDRRLHMLSDFSRSIQTYMQSDVFNEDLVKTPSFITHAFWQGTGDKFDFIDCSTINIEDSFGGTMNKSGVVAFLHDYEALGVTMWRKDTTSQYNGRGDYINFWANVETGVFNDLNENAVIFILD